MTDIIFLLLIFFIITARFTPEPIYKVALPKGAKTTSLQKKIVIVVNANDEYAIDDKRTNFDGVPAILDAELQKNPEATVSIHADKSVIYEKVMELVYIVDELGGKPVLALQP